MALADQINVIECGASELLGTGQQACKFDWNRIKTVEFSAPGYVYTVELDLDSEREAQQKEEIFIVKDAESFNLVPVEPTISTSDGSGVESVDGELPYKYDIMFRNKGYNFWKALRRFNSNGGAYNVAFWDIDGNKIMTQSKGGLIKGFATSMIFTGQYKGREGNTPAEFKMTIQLSDDVSQMERQVVISNETSGISISDLDGYNDVVLTPSPLSVASTSLVVSALLVDKSHFAAGLVLADFVIKKDGVAIVASAATPNETNKTYTFTIPAASAGTYTVDTTNTFGKKVVLLSATGLLYKGLTGTVIVT